MQPSWARPRHTRLTRYPANTYDLLKSVAVLTMVLDHIGVYLLPEILWLRVVGRAAFPLFLFLVGYSGHTRTDPRLPVAAAIVSGLDYLATGSVFPLNILWAIAITRFYLGHFPLPASRSHLWLMVAGWVVWVPIVAYGTAPLVFGILGAMARKVEGLPSTRFIIVLSILVGAHMVTQLLSFDFDPLQQLATLGIGIGLVWSFSRFQVVRLALPAPLLFVARYALEVYVLHIGVLVTIALPGRGGG
jgi:hypothetical protein